MFKTLLLLLVFITPALTIGHTEKYGGDAIVNPKSPVSDPELVPGEATVRNINEINIPQLTAHVNYYARDNVQIDDQAFVRFGVIKKSGPESVNIDLSIYYMPLDVAPDERDSVQFYINCSLACRDPGEYKPLYELPVGEADFDRFKINSFSALNALFKTHPMLAPIDTCLLTNS